MQEHSARIVVRFEDRSHARELLGARIQRSRSSHWNIEGRRNFGKSVNAGHSSRGARSGGDRRGCGRDGRGERMHRIRTASALQPLFARARTMRVYTESCKCDAYVMLVWPVTSSALPMTFTATTPCPCSSGVHPGQASTSLITKDSPNAPRPITSFEWADAMRLAHCLYLIDD